MKYINIRLFFYFLFFSLFFFAQGIWAMEEEEGRHPISLSSTYPRLQGQLYHFGTFIRERQGFNEGVRITLEKSHPHEDPVPRENWIYMSYSKPLTPNDTSSLYVGFNDFEALEHVATYVSSSIDQITYGYEVFNYLRSEHYLIFISMLSVKGRFCFSSKAICPAVLPEDLYTPAVEDLLSLYKKPRLASDFNNLREAFQGAGLGTPLDEVFNNEEDLRYYIAFRLKQKTIRHKKENTAPIVCASNEVINKLQTFFDKVTLSVPFSSQSFSSPPEDFTIFAESPKKRGG